MNEIKDQVLSLSSVEQLKLVEIVIHNLAVQHGIKQQERSAQTKPTSFIFQWYKDTYPAEYNSPTDEEIESLKKERLGKYL